MKTIVDIINTRNTCRAFQEKDIPSDVLDQLYDAAAKAPSGGGFQSVSVIAVTDQDKKDKLTEICRGQSFIKKAPLNLVFCIDYSRISRICELEPSPFDFTNQFMDFWMGIVDVSIMAHQVCLTAEALDLKSVYIGNVIHTIDQSSELLKLPKHVVPVIMLTIGYPKSEGKLSPKYDANVLIHNNEYKPLSDEALLTAYHQKNSEWKMQPKDKIVDKIHRTAKKQKGESFADSVVDWIKANDKISSYQYWFGAYYMEEDNFMHFDDYILYMKKQGFDWLE